MLRWSLQLWRRDSNQMASGKPGAVHSVHVTDLEVPPKRARRYRASFRKAVINVIFCVLRTAYP